MGRRRTALAGALLALAVLGPIVSAYGAQPASRYLLTAALAEHHSVDMSPYRAKIGVDHATYDNGLRSDKAPGQPLLAVPAYLVARAAGAESATHLRAGGDLGQWWVTLWSATIPFAVLLALMYFAARKYAPQHALLATLAIGFGTLLVPHAVNLYGHVLAAALGFGAFMVLDRAPPSPRRLALGGALLGLTVLVEYETLIIVAGVALYAAWTERRRAAWLLAGAAPAAAVLAWYQWAAFGAPWHTAYAYYGTAEQRRTIVGWNVPGWRGIDATLFGSRSLLIMTPVVLVGIAAAILLARRPGPGRAPAILAVGVSCAYVLVCICWRDTPFLEEPGPRFLIPMLPFLVVPLAVVWDKFRLAAVATALWGALLMVSAAVTQAHAGSTPIAGILTGIGDSPVREYVDRVVHGEFAPTIWSMAFGRFGIVVYGATVAAAVWFLVRAVAADAQPARELVGATQ